MTTINVSPKHSIVEATLFEGTPDSAWEILAILRDSAVESGNQSLSMTYNEVAGQGSDFWFYLNGDAYNVKPGDYLIKDDALLSVCRAADYPLRYATEAGLS